MGSSKKHKEKDRDRERRKEREKDEKRRDKDRHRKRDRDRQRDSDDSERKKKRGSDYDDLLEYAIEESQNDEGAGAAPSQSGGGGDASLSIEETNKLREKLGLKPLQVDSGESKNNENKTTLLDDIHVPAINIKEKEEQEKMRRKLEEIREKRRMYKKLGKVKGLGDEESDDDSAAAWVAKNRKKEEEKKMAEKRAQMLAEMDEEFGIGELIHEEFGHKQPSSSRKAYTSRDLRGLKVEHDETAFQDGQATILTLKDSSVLDDEGDTLYNVNIEDKEKANKNIELRKKGPAYKPYDDGEYDASGMLKARGILEKYDEEIDGESKKTFVLESGGSYDASKADELQQIQEKLKNEMVSLEMEKPRIASEYYTQEEMVQFKKPKKKRKVRKREALKADDLEAITSGDAGSGDHGSRTLKSILKSSSSKPASQDDDSMEITPLEQMDPDDVYQQATDDVALEDDDAQLELEIALQRSRRLKRKTEKTGAAKVIASLSTTVKQEPSSEEYGSIVIDSTSEFCRTLGEIPTYGTSGNREEEEEDEDEWKMDVVNETQEPQSGWELVKAQEDKKKEVTQESESNVLDDEPVVGNSVAAALQLAAKKGLLSSEGKRRVEEKFVADLPSVGVIDEEKMRGDDKDRSRGGRDYDRDRDRYGGGSRGEKEGYKPNVKLEYVDEKGRTLTPKEAFRYLSHKFHGKTPAKMKTEKRTKKILEEMAMQKMSSIDTPLNTAALLKEKQKEAQSPYLILSGGGKTLSTGASLTKGK